MISNNKRKKKTRKETVASDKTNNVSVIYFWLWCGLMKRNGFVSTLVVVILVVAFPRQPPFYNII